MSLGANSTTKHCLEGWPMNKRITCILVIVLVLLSMTACKKNDNNSGLGNIKGTVLSKQTNKPIYGVTVEVTSGKTVKKLETNEKGQYSTAVPAGNVTITASRAGYRTQHVTATLQKNAQLNLDPILLEIEDDVISIEGTATFAPSLPNWSAKVFVEVSIVDDNQKYADMKEVSAGTVQSASYHIEGLKRDRNYIIIGRAANLPGDAKIDGPQTQTIKNIIRKSEMADPEQNVFTVNISPETTELVAAVELYLVNTGRGLNDAGVDDDLDAIMEADDPLQMAITLSTTTVRGTIQDILSEPLGEATVVIIGSNTQLSAVSNATDGSFAITLVPIRYQGVRAEKAPRYFGAEQTDLELVAGVPCEVTLKLDPNPAVIPQDLNAAAALMTEDAGSGGALTDWLTSDFLYTYMMDAPEGKADAMADFKANYVAVRPGTAIDYEAVEESKVEFSFVNENWSMRRVSTYERYGYTASGTVRYGNQRWQLAALTVEGEVRLPLAPNTLTATVGDASAKLGWTAPVPEDPEIDGYKIYRTSTATMPAGDATPIGSVSVGSGGGDNAGLSYQENNLPTGTYYYWVRSVDEYAGKENLSDYSLCKEVYVVNALQTVQQFVTYALARDKASMTGMLADGFTWMPVGGSSISFDKAAFVNYIYDQFVPLSGLPVCSWVLDTSSLTFNRSTSGTNATVAVPASLAGRFSDSYAGKTRRWREVLETWIISLTNGKLQYFDFGARELLPAAPTNFRWKHVEDGNTIMLEWNKPNDPELKGYRIYRNTVNDFSKATLVTDLTSTKSDYSIDDIVDEQYFYWIVAYDNYDAESVPSAPVLIGVPEEIRVLAENFLIASFNKSETQVKQYTSFDFIAYLLYMERTLETYCDFINFSMAAPPYSIAYYQVINPGPEGGPDKGSDEYSIRASDDWTRYRLTFVKRDEDGDPVSICTWSGVTCMAITVHITNIDDAWWVYQADFLNAY
jgi:hypothetical protein